MGIERYNIAACDKCGREYKSLKTQAALKKELTEKGWEFKGMDLFCPTCSGHRIYTGAIKETKLIGDTYYIEVVNSNITVHIEYGQFFEKININTIPSAIYLRGKIEKDGGDPDKVKYVGTRKVKVGEESFFVADLVK